MNRRKFLLAAASVPLVAYIPQFNNWCEVMPSGQWVHFCRESSPYLADKIVAYWTRRGTEFGLGFIDDCDSDRKMKSLKFSINCTIYHLDERDGFLKYKFIYGRLNTPEKLADNSRSIDEYKKYFDG